MASSRVYKVIPELNRNDTNGDEGTIFNTDFVADLVDLGDV